MPVQVSPIAGTTSGGAVIRLTGPELAGVHAVLIGGVPATGITDVGSNTFTAVTPSRSRAEQVEVVVETECGSITIPGGFAYVDMGWAELLAEAPDPEVVSEPSLREAIARTGLPWRVRDRQTSIELLLVPPGTFAMGSDADDSSQPVREVTISQAFYLGRFLVTQSQWTAVMERNPSRFQDHPESPSRPVESISWIAIQEFEAKSGLRLPTEAEWEYACRAGTASEYNNGSDDFELVDDLGWFGAEYPQPTHVVGLKLANRLGFYDMHGNVGEWCDDWYNGKYYAKGPSVDPPGASGGTTRVFRSSHHAVASSSYSRHGLPPDMSDPYLGFRAARSVLGSAVGEESIGRDQSMQQRWPRDVVVCADWKTASELVSKARSLMWAYCNRRKFEHVQRRQYSGEPLIPKIQCVGGNGPYMIRAESPEAIVVLRSIARLALKDGDNWELGWLDSEDPDRNRERRDELRRVRCDLMAVVDEFAGYGSFMSEEEIMAWCLRTHPDEFKPSEGL